MHQNAKCYKARQTLGRAPQARSFLRAKRAAREARDENVRAKQADFFSCASKLAIVRYLCNETIRAVTV